MTVIYTALLFPWDFTDDQTEKSVAIFVDILHHNEGIILGVFLYFVIKLI